jgi:hypothetical protein
LEGVAKPKKQENPFYQVKAENLCFLPTNYILTRHLNKKNSEILIVVETQDSAPAQADIPPQSGRTPPHSSGQTTLPTPRNGPAATDRVGTPARPSPCCRSVRCRSVRVPMPWSCRSSRGVAAELEVRLGRVGQWLGGGFLEGRFVRCQSVRVPTPWSCRRAQCPAWPCGAVAGRRIFGRRRMIRCFYLHLHFCVFFVSC